MVAFLPGGLASLGSVWRAGRVVRLAAARRRAGDTEPDPAEVAAPTGASRANVDDLERHATCGSTFDGFAAVDGVDLDRARPATCGS